MHKKKPSLTVCCLPGLDNFTRCLVRGLAPYCNIRSSNSANPADHLAAMKAADVIWLEWGSQMTEALCRQKEFWAGKQVIVRIHNYEVLDRLVNRIDFSLVTDIIFVSSYLRDLFYGLSLRIPEKCRIHVIHNGIDLRRFRYIPRTDSKIHIAFLASVSYHKDPMVLMHAFAFLHKRFPDLKLHAAGRYQNPVYELSIPHFLRESGLENEAVFYGHIQNTDEWLSTKDFIFSSSLLESQGVGLLEAMSRGCRPLIYNFPGARSLYLPNQLWDTFDDLEQLFLSGPEPKEVSDFTARYYSLNRELASWLKVILSQETVTEFFDFSSGTVSY